MLKLSSIISIQDAESSPLEVTPRHVVYLNREHYPIPVGQVNVDNNLQEIDVMGALNKQTVTMIEHI